jgi:hypothetical protein
MGRQVGSKRKDAPRSLVGIKSHRGRDPATAAMAGEQLHHVTELVRTFESLSPRASAELPAQLYFAPAEPHNHPGRAPGSSMPVT